MKVVYDATAFAVWSEQAAGIPKTAKQVALGLARTPKCELTFCSSLPSLELWNRCQDYLNSISDFRHVPFIGNKKFKIYKPMYRLFRQLNQIGFNQTERIKNTLEAAVTGAHNFLPITSKDLLRQDIYHATFFDFPRKIKEAKNLKRFLTVYDLIPILHPDLSKAFFHYLNHVLNALTYNDYIICISHSTRNDLCNYLKTIDSKKVFVVYPSISELFHPCLEQRKIVELKQKYKIPDCPYILTLSPPRPHKNLSLVIRSFAQLIQEEKIHDLTLVMSGISKQDYHTVLSEISNLKGLKDRIVITGPISEEDLPLLYSGALMFVFPSFYEGFGLPPLEAMQCGTPVITSNTSSLSEVVGDAGIMINPKNSDALCQAILDLYRNPSLRNKLSVMSIERAGLFSRSRNTEETIAAYNKSLS